MSRRHDEERTRQIRQSRTRRSDRSNARDGRGYDYGPYYDRNGDEFYEDYDGNRHYSEPHGGRYDRDREREYYYRDRGQRQETKRTGLKVAGVICVAVIALVGLLAVTGGEDPAQTAEQPQQVPQQAPQQAPQQQAPGEAPQQAPAAPQVPEVPENPASQEQVEGLRAEIDRQFAELRQSIDQLRVDIMSWFQNSQTEQ